MTDADSGNPLVSSRDVGSGFRLSVRHSTPIALNAELSCAKGELLVLVGPSGSGKSTLLRMIAGLSCAEQGKIECNSTCWFDRAREINHSPQQRHVGYMPQHYGLFPHLTALENVIAGLDHLQSSARERIARIWMEKVHLDGLESRRPASMSGGQQQRVALARALARDPAILLLDEPFSSVDRATRETLYQELATLKTQLKIPTILVTHDLNEALLLADRMTLIAQGQTLQSGIPSDVMANPTNETAARLLGIRNLFDGEILRHDLKAGLTWIKAGDQSLACMLAAQWNPGAKVRWMVPNSGVRLRAISNGDLPSSHNRVRLRTLTLLPLGDHAHITASTLGMHEPLHLQLPLRLATELEMKPGATVDAVLREDSLRILQSV